MGQLLVRCARLLNEAGLARMRVEMGLPGIRTSHTSLFPFIELEGTRLTDLAARVGVSKQAVGQLVEELEELGILERAPDPADGRAKLVRFSARGRRGLLEGLAVLRRMEAELSARLAGGDMERLHGILLRLLAALETGPAAVIREPAAKRSGADGHHRQGRRR